MQLGSGLEAIAFQRTRPLFKLLTAEVQKLMDQMKADDVVVLTDKMLAGTKIAELLQVGSGFKKITLVADQSAPINAFTNLITLSNMHAFHDSFTRMVISQADAYNLFRQCNNVLQGQVDLETGTVSGDFAKIPITIGMGSQMLNPKYGFTAEEIAAVYLHEAGHDVTYCYALHYTCTTNLVLQLGAKAIVAADDVKQKHAIMSDVANTLGIRIDNMADLTNYDKFENYYITMLSLYRKKVYDALGAPSYSSNMSEQMADMYAARHGAGNALVSGLNRMNKLFVPTFKQKLEYNLKTTLAFILFMPFVIPMMVVGLLTNDFIAGTYDLDKDRFIRIRNEAIASLKDTQLTASEKRTILNEIEQMNKIIAETDNDWSVPGRIAILIRSSQRDQMRNKRLQQDLEALLNNPLYATAAKYSV